MYNALINPADFYTPIYQAKFNALETGFVVSIPLQSKYSTEYGFAICVPINGDYFSQDFSKLDGHLLFQFMDDNKVIREIKMVPNNLIRLSMNENKHEAFVFKFNLPSKDNLNADRLDVKVLSPISQLSKYRGTISCLVRAIYSPK